MKKISVLIFTLFASSLGFAAPVTNAVVCSGGTSASSGTIIAGDTSGSSFVVTDIAPKCSANVLLNYSQTQIGLAVASASQKGKYIFTGNTGGGSVGPNGGVCTASKCDATQLGTPLGTAMAAAT